MRYARRLSISKRWLSGALPLCTALALGCQGSVGGVPSGGGGSSSTGGAGGASYTNPCTGPTDSRLVPAPQRILLLTSPEMVNTVSYLINATEGTAIANANVLNLTADSDRSFPPAAGEKVTDITDVPTLTPISNMAQTVGQYVNDNFAAVTGCATATDACAQTYLTGVAARAYRRQLTAAETTRFMGLYSTLRNQTVNGYVVTATVQQATQYSVNALLMSPQLLWRWELGNSAAMSTSPPGIYLTDDELATQVSFFLTDQPPDDTLLAAAKGGTLRANLASQVTRILATQGAKDWLRTIMETYFLLNQLPKVISTVDPTKFPLISTGLLADMGTEASMFLDNTLWNGKLVDLLTSNTTYLNTYLAENIYKIPDPPGATLTNFVQTTLDPTQRSGIISNAGFIARSARSDGIGMIIPRGRAIMAAFTGYTTAAPPPALADQIAAALANFDMETGQQQVAFRAMTSPCNGCHTNFDPFGLLQENYDNLGSWRTVYDSPAGVAIDAHAALPAALGGATLQNAVDLAKTLSQSPLFINTFATSILQYALVDSTAPVELPLPPSQAGCAATDVVQRYQAAPNKTFTDLVNATTSSPAFVLRAVTP